MSERTRVLVVDDDPTGRILLRNQLAKLGYEVIEAANGEDGVLLFSREHPDIVLMDVVMPGIDGFEATRIIKQQAGDNFVPVVYLTGLDREEDLVKGLDVGGDDYLVKPVSRSMLAAKLKSVERVRQLNARIFAQNEILVRDEEFAERLFSRVIMADNAELDHFGVMYKPARTFSGDLLLSARSPSGDLHLLVADFTGHGLPAAIGAMPLSQIFKSMTRKGYDPVSILTEMNYKLHRILPADMFCAACFVSINPDASLARLWNCGLPNALLLDPGHGIRQQIPSSHFALGILESLDDQQPVTLALQTGQSLAVLTDGVIEAQDLNGTMFGMERVEQVLAGAQGGLDGFARLRDELDNFTYPVEQRDDITLLVVPCDETIRVADAQLSVQRTGPRHPARLDTAPLWKVQYELSPASLRAGDPVPGIINQITDLVGSDQARQELFMILSELYNNALDHGLLQLDSGQKNSDAGFAQYFEERQRRLQALQQGLIRISLHACRLEEGEVYVVIQVEDSGAGFDIRIIQHCLQVSEALSGRGIPLVSELCETLEYSEAGNRVEAVYRL